MEAENRELKQMYTELSLTSQFQQEIIKSYSTDVSSEELGTSTSVTILCNN